jgi:hypothetical protein
MLWRGLFAASLGFFCLGALALVIASGMSNSPGGIPFGLTSLAFTAAATVAGLASAAVRELQRRIDRLERRQPPGPSDAERRDAT